MSTVPQQHRSEAPPTVRCAVVTVSDTRTLATDTGGAALVDMAFAAGHVIVDRQIVPDEPDPLSLILRQYRDRRDIDAVLVTGGTGLGSRDQTFETVSHLITKPMPGYGELFRMLSYAEIGPAAMLSRAVGGLMDRTVVLAMPGSRAAVVLAMEKLILPELASFMKRAVRPDLAGSGRIIPPPSLVFCLLGCRMADDAPANWLNCRKARLGRCLKPAGCGPGCGDWDAACRSPVGLGRHLPRAIPYPLPGRNPCGARLFAAAGPYVLLAEAGGPRHLQSYRPACRTRQTIISPLSKQATSRQRTPSRIARVARREGARLPPPPCRRSAYGHEATGLVVQPRAGSTAGEHLVRHGRMPPMVVLEVAARWLRP